MRTAERSVTECQVRRSWWGAREQRGNGCQCNGRGRVEAWGRFRVAPGTGGRVRASWGFGFGRGSGSGGGSGSVGLGFPQAVVTCTAVGFELDFDLFNKEVE